MKVHPQQSDQSGFTLIEVMVAVSIFAIVMTVGVGALMSLNSAYKKSQTQRAAFDSLNFIVDTLGRDIRTGSRYVQSPTPSDFDGSIPFPPTTGSNVFSFRNQDGCDITYRRAVVSGGVGIIERRIESNPILDCMLDSGGFETLTSEDIIDVTALRFFLRGSSNAVNDDQQPMVSFVIDAQTQLGAESTEITLQTSITQRLLDVPSGS